MKAKNILSWLVLALSITAFFLGITKAFSGQAFAADAKKARTYTGHVDFVHKDKIVIDDFEMELATGAGHIKQGSKVQFTIDDQGRVVKIKNIVTDRSKSRKEGPKTSMKKVYKADLKKPIKKEKPAKSGSKIKKSDGVWRNY